MKSVTRVGLIGMRRTACVMAWAGAAAQLRPPRAAETPDRVGRRYSRNPKPLTIGKVRPVLQARESPDPPYALYGQSKKGIRPESPIGPCIATDRVDNRRACVSETMDAVTTAKREPQEGRTASPLRRRRQPPYRLGKTTLSNGWAQCREKSALSRRKVFSLDIPSYRASSTKCAQQRLKRPTTRYARRHTKARESLRNLAMSFVGAFPKKRLYSLLNCEALK